MPPIATLVALADPTRCRILEILRDGAQPVHVLAGNFNISRPAISRHLRVLKQARLISEKKFGRENRYALHANRLKPVTEWLESFVMARQQVSSPKIPASTPGGSKPGARTKPFRQSANRPAPIPDGLEQPVPAATKPKPAAERSVSQMGFDF